MSTTIAIKSGATTEKKIVSISSKRQITIPQKFFSLLGFDKEAECIIRGNELIIRPTKTTSGGEFAEYILADLIEQGLSGKELLTAFKKKQAKMRPAVEAMLAEANQTAIGNSDFYTYDDVFNSENEK